jgi:hypothetical protein
MKEFDFALLEKKLNIATELIDELDIESHELSMLPSIDITPSIVASVSADSHEIFSIDSLKSDFILIRNNVMKLITTGQRILESASVLDVGDLKPATLSALATLQQTVGSNLKLMVSIYKEICEIEKMRLGISGKVPDGSVEQRHGSTTTNNTIVFSGNTSALLDIIKENHK